MSRVSVEINKIIRPNQWSRYYKTKSFSIDFTTSALWYTGYMYIILQCINMRLEV